MRGWIALSWTFLGANAALACGVCLSVQGNPLALPHPRALEVAVATRNALDRDLLRPMSAAASGWSSREKPSARTMLLDKMKRQCSAATASIHFVFVDTSEAVVVVGRGNQWLCPAHNVDAADCVVVTSSHALKALLDGRLRFDDAIGRKLIVVEGQAKALTMLLS